MVSLLLWQCWILQHKFIQLFRSPKKRIGKQNAQILNVGAKNRIVICFPVVAKMQCSRNFKVWLENMLRFLQLQQRFWRTEIISKTKIGSPNTFIKTLEQYHKKSFCDVTSAIASKHKSIFYLPRKNDWCEFVRHACISHSLCVDPHTFVDLLRAFLFYTSYVQPTALGPHAAQFSPSL